MVALPGPLAGPQPPSRGELGEGEGQEHGALRRTPGQCRPPRRQQGDGGDRGAQHQHPAHRGRVEQLLAGWSRRALQHTGIGGLVAHGHPGQPVGQQVHPQALPGLQRHRQPHERAAQHDEDLGQATRERVVQEAPQVVVHPAALGDRGHQGGQVVAGAHQRGGLLGHLGPATHRDADVGAAQRGGRRSPASAPGAPGRTPSAVPSPIRPAPGRCRRRYPRRCPRRSGCRPRARRPGPSGGGHW